MKIFALFVLAIVPNTFSQTPSQIVPVSALPPACQMGQSYYLTTGKAGQYNCGPDNTWSHVATDLSVTSGSSVSLPPVPPGAPISENGLTITPSNAFARMNGSVILTSTKPVTWRLMAGSAGTLTVDSTTQATYTAPVSVPAQMTRAGCPVLANDNALFAPVDKLPLNANNANWTNTGPSMALTPSKPYVTTASLSFGSTWGLDIADATTPTRAMQFYYTFGNNGVFPFPGIPNHTELGSMNFSNDDHHRLIARKDTCSWYELYNAAPDGTPYAGRAAGTTANAQSGLAWPWYSYATASNGSTDAASLPLTPLTLTIDEVMAGHFNHPIRFSMAGGYIDADKPAWPSNSTNGCHGVCPNAPPYGTRWRLKAGYTPPAGLSAAAQGLVASLKTEGIILADAGPGFTGSVDQAVYQYPISSLIMAEIGKLKLQMSNFEAVDQSPLMLAQNSWEINPANSYVQPAGAATVLATDATTPTNQVYVPIPLGPVTVGVPSQVLSFLAGNYSQQLPSWVNGSANQNVAWSLSAPLGSITPAGVYTPPATLPSVSYVTATATAAADPTAKENTYLVLWPSSNGSLRIDSGNWSATTDGSGNAWQPDVAADTGAWNHTGGDYPNWASLSTSPLRTQYQSQGYGYGDDFVETLYMPNGAKNVRLMFGGGYYGCAAGGNTTLCGPIKSGTTVDVDIYLNGKLVQPMYDFASAVNYARGMVTDLNFPVTVTNQMLQIALIIDNPVHGTLLRPGVHLNGIEITPVSAATK